MKHKLETFVNFPIHDLDLTKYVANKNLSQPQLYELYALTNHYGGMRSGHYTPHIKSKLIMGYVPVTGETFKYVKFSNTRHATRYDKPRNHVI
ncbi:hypothetical protein Bca4012_028488 [Brassica carinata]